MTRSTRIIAEFLRSESRLLVCQDADPGAAPDTGRNPFADAEPAGQGGWICNVGIGELKVYSGPQSWEAWESTLKRFKLDKQSRTQAPSFGKQAYFLYSKPVNESQGNVAFLVTKSGNHTLCSAVRAC